MRRLFPLLIAALVGGGGYFLQKYEIKGLDQVVIRPRGASGVETTGASWTPFGGAASGKQQLPGGQRDSQRRSIHHGGQTQMSAVAGQMAGGVWPDMGGNFLCIQPDRGGQAQAVVMANGVQGVGHGWTIYDGEFV